LRASIIIFIPFCVRGSGTVAFFDRGTGSSYKVLTSSSSLLEAKSRSISYKGLVSLLTPSVANLWLLACGSLSSTRARYFTMSWAVYSPFPFAFKDLIALTNNIRYTISSYISLIEMLSSSTTSTQLPLIIGILSMSRRKISLLLYELPSVRGA
jgi:hypothetical protein